MAHYTEWLPTVRSAQIAMSRDWISLLGSGGKAAAWSIPTTAVQSLGVVYNTAQTALETAQNETTRTPVANAQCREAFDVLVAAMRDMKRRYFLTPPLSDADYISLGLRPHDNTPTPSGTPTAQVTIETYLVGRHELGIRIVYVTGNPDDKANKGYRIYYKIVAPGAVPPAAPGELIKSFFTKRRKDVMEFDFGDSGKTVWFAVQVENEGKKVPWGPLVSALIP
jgi:hypothetical protein